MLLDECVSMDLISELLSTVNCRTNPCAIKAIITIEEMRIWRLCRTSENTFLVRFIVLPSDIPELSEIEMNEPWLRELLDRVLRSVTERFVDLGELEKSNPVPPRYAHKRGHKE